MNRQSVRMIGLNRNWNWNSFTLCFTSLPKPDFGQLLRIRSATDRLSILRGFRILVHEVDAKVEKYKYKSSYGIYQHAAVAADSKLCSDIGRDVMALQGGNAIDAAVTTALCSSVIFPNSTGIGGGAFILLYHKNHGWHAIDARETAPMTASRDMFVNKPVSQNEGAMSICVPGLLKGIFEMHTRFGSLPWKTVVAPAIKLLQEGFPLLPHPYGSLVCRVSPFVEELKGFEMFFDANIRVKPVGSIIRMPKLARTFQILAEDPGSFYEGVLAQDIVRDIQDAGGVIQADDFENYKALFKTPTEMILPGNQTLYSVPPPAAGPILSYVMSIMAGYNMTAEDIATDESKILTYHRFLEAVKFSEARRTALGDEDFVDIKSLVKDLTSGSYGEATRLLIGDSRTRDFEYYGPSFDSVEGRGTSHLSVLDREGNAVSLTGSIQNYFGSLVVGRRTGIIFNDQMNDFSHPHPRNPYDLQPAEANFIQPGKRPLSAMCPTIVWDHQRDRVSVVTGAAGAFRIPAALAQTLMDILWFDMSLPGSLDKPRLYVAPQPPMNIMADESFSNTLKARLEKKGHCLSAYKMLSVIQMIQVVGDSIVAASDFRKGGQPSGF